MLGKLIKNEFKATARYFLPLYIFIAVLTPLFSLSMYLLNNTGDDEAGIAMSLLGLSGVAGFIILMFAIAIATFILVVLHFYRTTATSEAYLTFTLPVKTWQIIFSKTLCAFVWEICSGIMAVAAVLSMTFILKLWTPSDVRSVVNFLSKEVLQLNISDVITLVVLFFTVIFSVLAGIGRIFLSISLGQLFQNHRVLISIGFYLAIYVALQIANSIISVPLLLTENFDLSSSGNGILYYAFSAIECAVIAGVCLFFTSRILRKHLNVQ
jgi:hypothetical protein